MSTPQPRPEFQLSHDPVGEMSPGNRFDNARAIIELIQLASYSHAGRLEAHTIADALSVVDGLLAPLADVVEWGEEIAKKKAVRK
jgi:hypothetical protein